MPVDFTALASIIGGLTFVVWPATWMAWHQKGWSWFAGDQPAEWAANKVFMPPHFIYPRVLGAGLAALGVWMMFGGDR